VVGVLIVIGAGLLDHVKTAHFQFFMIFWSLDKVWAFPCSQGKKTQIRLK